MEKEELEREKTHGSFEIIIIHLHTYTHTHMWNIAWWRKQLYGSSAHRRKKNNKNMNKTHEIFPFFLSPSYAYDASSIVMFYIINIRSRALCFFKCWGKSMHQLQFMTLFFFIFKNGFLFILLLWEWQRELQTPPNSFVVVLTQEIVFN